MRKNFSSGERLLSFPILPGSSLRPIIYNPPRCCCAARLTLSQFHHLLDWQLCEDRNLGFSRLCKTMKGSVRCRCDRSVTHLLAKKKLSFFPFLFVKSMTCSEIQPLARESLRQHFHTPTRPSILNDLMKTTIKLSLRILQQSADEETQKIYVKGSFGPAYPRNFGKIACRVA